MSALTVYTAKNVAAMRSAIFESFVRDITAQPGYSEDMARSTVSPSFVEDILRTYILAGVDAQDLISELEKDGE